MLKIAQKSDIPTIQALAYQIWREHYVPIIGAEQVEYMLEMIFTTEQLAQKMDGDLTFYLIQEANSTVGFLSMNKDGENAYFIDKFYIQTRGKGLGEATFKALIAQYPDANTIHLTVNKHNYKSINFYFKMGFKIEKTAVFDIGNNYVMDDFVMVWKRMLVI
jgi:diamine N-acetyltransferase